MRVLLLSCLFAQVAAHGHLLTPAPRQCKEGSCGGAGYIDDELSPINFNGDEPPREGHPRRCRYRKLTPSGLLVAARGLTLYLCLEHYLNWTNFISYFIFTISWYC